MKNAAAVSLLLALAFAADLAGQTPGAAGIVYGRDHAFAVKAPTGWVLDNSSGREQGLHAVFYPKDETWASAKTVMYANAASKSVPGQRTIEELMAYDLEQFRRRAPNVSVTPSTAIKTGDDRTAVVRKFEGDQYGNFEAVAYIDEKTVVVLLVLSARTKDGLEKAYPAFEELVRSYQFMTADVRIEK